MSQIIEISENLVEKFLLENKYIWNGVVCNVDGEEKDATYEDFDGTPLYIDLVSLNGKETVKACIDEVNFKLYKQKYDRGDYLYKDLREYLDK